MSQCVAFCPRCFSRQSIFDVHDANPFELRAGWQRCFEAFAVCRCCKKSVIFVLVQNQADKKGETYDRSFLLSSSTDVEKYFTREAYLDMRDLSAKCVPGYVPDDIKNVFIEATACCYGSCHAAAAFMFGVCAKMVIKKLGDGGEKGEVREQIISLLDRGLLSPRLRELAVGIKVPETFESVSEEMADDWYIFVSRMLEDAFTWPGVIKHDIERREKGRQGAAAPEAKATTEAREGS